MRIAIVNWSSRRFGGTGTYLGQVMPALRAAGHDVGLWYEVDRPDGHPPLGTCTDSRAWSVDDLGIDAAVRGLREWSPDVLYVHGLLDAEVEQRVLEVAPAIYFAHDFRGTCISGLKAHGLPTMRPCDRTFGWQCLAQYYPRRCGGWSPVSMIREYRTQQGRLDLLRNYAAIVTHSERLRVEYIRHGFEPSRVLKVRFGAEASSGSCGETAAQTSHPGAWRLLFVGRMYRVKGGRELIAALPRVARTLGRRLQVTFAGEGAQRAEWEQYAARVSATDPAIAVEFTGWLQPGDLDALYRSADLLVVPSLWPEPFGLVGSEAGRHGLPAAAFDVGGIREWLTDGVNGHLAPGNPPTVDGLADAVIACLADEHVHARLREGARRQFDASAFRDHVSDVLGVLDRARVA